ncbi:MULTISPECIES: hypothetical protein [Dethiosulfovibrio]|uniref:Uncharacterized protein n=2 Tax=Dethiosulfovibrio TaxID=47054 RepID=A0ABS9EPJ1_9BACT|nr:MULTISPECIES: hypothetical protein [Dethiosulfovibrio]MCF4114710.1 hypothetical protein [Dethiosulfovibrio russensis]MCF4143085.1 hypothetical protein [Dethiosulfovibrio marinus]MCF4145215.1 hypothetical protein [Dethiosulfovibrio acidaminovorans]
MKSKRWNGQVMKHQKTMMENDRRKAAAEAEANRIRAAMNCPVVCRMSAGRELAELRDRLELERAELDYAARLVERYKDSSARRRQKKAELLVATLERRVRSAERAVC